MRKEKHEPSGMTGRGTQTFLLICLVAFLTGCSGSRLIKHPEPFEPTAPLEQVSNQHVTASLQWVIVRDGPGAWAENSNWDEYLVSVHNHTEADIQVTSALIVDSTGFELPSDSDRRRLLKASRKTVKRYQDVVITNNVGKAGEALATAAGIAAGIGVGYLANAAVDAAIEAALMDSVTTTGSMGVAAGTVLIVAPILIAAGIAQSVNNHKVADEIEARHTALPATVAPGETLQLNLFFPIAPSPQRIDIAYDAGIGEKVVSLDTTEVLDGLHIPSARIQDAAIPDMDAFPDEEAFPDVL